MWSSYHNFIDIESTSKEKLTPDHKTTNKGPKLTKAAMKLLSIEAEKDFEEINKKLDETRRMYTFLF